MWQQQQQQQGGFSSNPPPYMWQSPQQQWQNGPNGNPENEETEKTLRGRIKKAKQESGSNIFKFIGLVTEILCNSFVTSVLLCITCPLPLAEIIIGAVYKDSCSMDSRIPTWLIVYGIFSLLLILSKAFLSFVDIIRNSYPDYQFVRIFSILVNVITILNSIFIIIWFIVGNALVYGNFSNMNTGSNGCNIILYWFSFILITLTWIATPLICCCICCMVAAAGGIGICGKILG